MNTYIEILGKQVHKIGIGTWLMGGGVNSENGIVFADYDNDEKDIVAIRYSIEQGQNHIDTAQLYGERHCEELVGEAIKDLDRENLFIASKVWKSHSKRSAVLRSIEESLKRLNLDYIDMMYIHSGTNAFGMDEYIPGLNDAVDEGLIKGLAVSNFSLEQIKEAQALSKHPIIANQVLYNIIERERSPQELIDYCQEQNILVVAYRPVERRLLADKCELPEVLELAKKYNKTPAQISINWLLTQNIIPIPKASQQAHIEENLGALNFELSSEDVQILKDIELK